MSKDLSALSKGVVHRSPDELHCVLGKSLLLVLEVQPGNDKGVQAHLSEQSLVSTRVTEWIDVPTDARSNAEFFLHKLMALHHVVDHVLIIDTGLILHAPASVEQLKSSILDKLAHTRLGLFALVLPPHGEKLHLDIGKLLSFILQ